MPESDAHGHRRAAWIQGLIGFVVALLIFAGGFWAQGYFKDQLGSDETAILVSARARARWIRAKNMTMQSNGSRCASRWQDYMDKGLMPWNEDYSAMKWGIKKYYPELNKKFLALQDEFANLHHKILAYQASGCDPSKPVLGAARAASLQTEKVMREVSDQLLDLDD